jgi:MoxR-like ATPase
VSKKSKSKSISTGDYEQFLPWENKSDLLDDRNSPDDRSGAVYLHDARLQLATEIAIATRRPLLLRGEPGSGKSSYAPFVARNLNWRYYEFNVTGRTEAKDLLWRFDALRRLRDAQAGKEVIDLSPQKYITPGVIWWAFNRIKAIEFLDKQNEEQGMPTPRSSSVEPFPEINSQREEGRAVVLIDEIDKADPNVPNDLLEVLGLNSFTVDETRDVIRREIPATKDDGQPANKFGSLLIIMTTNDERDLPPAFIRRCIVHNLEEPDDEQQQIERWKEIARLHMGQMIALQDPEEQQVERLAQKCWQLRNENKNAMRKSPCTAEFLDALRACFMLKIKPDSPLWQRIEQNVLVKKLEREM